MSKTWLSVWTALGLVLLSVGLFLARWYALGNDISGAGTWKVTLTASGELTADDAVLTSRRPPDFRYQHILDERFRSKELLHHIGRGKDLDRSEVIWRPARWAGSQPFRLSYSFRCQPTMRDPTRAMSRHTRLWDAAPAVDQAIKPGIGIESDHKEIARQAGELAAQDQSGRHQVQ